MYGIPVGLNRYDLAVAYRIYPKVAKAAQSLPFGDNKLQQAETCLASFRMSLGSLRVKIWAILDGCPQAYRVLFERHFAAQDLVFVELDRAGNRATFGKQIDILLAQRDAEFVYFAEDDYLYATDQFPRMVEFLKGNRDADFVTPYDHPDCYRLELHREPKWLRIFEGHHWRTASSTCLTFLTRRRTLARYEHVFRTYTHGNNDCALWLSLTKRKIADPLLSLRYLVRGESDWRIFAKAWRYCWPQIVFGTTSKLWAPVPGLATHLCAELLSPGRDWMALMWEEARRANVYEPEALPAK